MNPPSLPPLPDDAHSSPSFGTTTFRIKVIVAFCLIFGFLLWQNVAVRQDKVRTAKSERVSQYIEALTHTKSAYSFRSYQERYRTSNAKPYPDLLEDQAKAIKDWKKLAESPDASASDWRRLGIVKHTFDKPADGDKSLAKAAELATKPRTKAQRDNFEVEPFPPIAKTPKVEKELWQQIYSKKPTRELGDLRKQLSELRLGWFEHLVLAQVYRNTGNALDAAAEKSAALASCHRMNLFQNLRIVFTFFGLFVLVGYGLQTLVRQFRSKPASHPIKDTQASSKLPFRAFTFRARLTAFLLYFSLYLLSSIVLMLFSSVLTVLFAPSPLMVTRIRAVEYLLVSFGTVAFALWAMHRMMRGHSQTQSSSAHQSVLGRLGLGSKEPLREIGIGFYGFGMALFATVIAGLISEFLFSQFKTPSHPIVRELLLMTSVPDRLLMLLQTAIAAAITEEIMFRGVLYPAFRERYGVVRGILITSALFALVHPTLPGGFLPLMTLGIAFNLAYEKRGSLLPGITMHALNNGLIILSQFALLSS